MLDTQLTQFHRTHIKFCGITQLADAHYAEALGVDALGFVFYEKSPRYLSDKMAATICNQLLPFTTKVGLFVDATAGFVQQTLKTVKLDLLQFHGDESDNFCNQFQKPYIKAIQVKTHEEILQAVNQYPNACGMLLDSFHAEKRGGTGEAFDWSIIPTNCGKPVILAGGLTAENVKRAIQTVQPYAVDVSSGIEISKGKKDFQKMRAFVEEVKNAYDL